MTNGQSNGHYTPLTLEEALQTGKLEIKEKGTPTVPELLVINQAEEDVLILGGEELLGALQNRVVNVSMLVGAKSILAIPVSCTERGRWQASQSGVRMRGVSPHFPVASVRQVLTTSVCRSLRTRGSYQADQSTIWHAISAALTAHKIHSATTAHSDLFATKEDEMEEYLAGVQLTADQVGMITLLNGQVLSLDLFGSPETFSRVFPKMLRAYALEAEQRPGSSSQSDD